MRSKKNISGISAVELLLGALLCALMLLAIAKLLPMIVDFYRQPANRASVQTQTLNSMNIMFQFLNGASAHSIRITTPPGQPLWSSIEFQKPLSDATHTYQNYQFVQSGQKLLMITGGAGGRVTTLAQNVTFVSFLLPGGMTDPLTLTISLLLQPAGEAPSGRGIFLQRSIRLTAGS